MKRPKSVMKGVVAAFVRSCVAAVALGFSALNAGAVSIDTSTQLDADRDYRGQGAVTIAAGVTLDLNGHKLFVDGLDGTGTITDPRGYDVLEYLTFKADDVYTGQKIHLGFTPLPSDRLEMRFIIPENIPNNRNYALWCARGGSSANTTYTCFAKGAAVNTPPNLLRYDYCTDNIKQSAYFRAGDIVHTVVTDPAAGTRALDGVTSNDFTQKSFTVGSELVIGAAHNALGPSTFAHYGNFRVCDFKVTGSDGALKHDFVPARRCSDGAVGLLDRETGEFKQNSGNSSVPLEAGPVIGSAFADGVGELHVDVSDDGVVNLNNGVTLSGRLRLVKEGTGTVVLGATKQYNSGGWEIAAGTVKPTGNLKNYQSFGVLNSKVTVRAGATYDMNGQSDSRYYNFILDGGTIANTGNEVLYGCMGKITLTKDSALDVKSSFPLWDIVDLNGYTLDIDISSGKYLHLYTGTFVGCSGKCGTASGGMRSGWLRKVA